MRTRLRIVASMKSARSSSPRIYGGKVGALVYTCSGVRIDAAAVISRLGARRHLRPSPLRSAELERHADRTIVYLAQMASRGVTFDGNAAYAGRMSMYSDSDWAVGHSTTGWALMFAGDVVSGVRCAAFAFASKRQACIAASSTEAELIACSTGALEVVHARRLMAEMGLPQLEATTLKVDI